MVSVVTQPRNWGTFNALKGQSVLVTGDTGFKGAWLACWLHQLGAHVTGYARPPEHAEGIFVRSGLANVIRHVDGELRDLSRILALIRETRPRIVFHLAAQALVRESYQTPVETVTTNALGTVHLLEALRLAGNPCAVVIVTSDKCYENREWAYAYRENDELGGHDLYSASKGAAELLTSAYRRSFFPPAALGTHGIAVATARAGNVIGPGDWAQDRIVPDAIRALQKAEAIRVRNPRAVRPWQHVLEPLAGYLLLATRLLARDGASFCEAWNFGPQVDASIDVATLVKTIVSAWGKGRWEEAAAPDSPHEATHLRLAIDKAVFRLGWKPTWGLTDAVLRTVAGYKVILDASLNEAEIRAMVTGQIAEYINDIE